MFEDWRVIGSLISLGLIVKFAYFDQKSQMALNKKIKYVHIRNVRNFKTLYRM